MEVRPRQLPVPVHLSQKRPHRRQTIRHRPGSGTRRAGPRRVGPGHRRDEVTGTVSLRRTVDSPGAADHSVRRVGVSHPDTATGVPDRGDPPTGLPTSTRRVRTSTSYRGTVTATSSSDSSAERPRTRGDSGRPVPRLSVDGGTQQGQLTTRSGPGPVRPSPSPSRTSRGPTPRGSRPPSTLTVGTTRVRSREVEVGPLFRDFSDMTVLSPDPVGDLRRPLPEVDGFISLCLLLFSQKTFCLITNSLQNTGHERDSRVGVVV